MPWREICPMDEKVRLVAAVLAAEHSMSELCESFGISRKTGYKWLLRYRAHGAEGLHELSRAPQRVPWAISEAQAAAIVGGAPRASALGAQEAAGQAQRTCAAGGLASAEHDWRITAPARVDAHPQTAPTRGAQCGRAQGPGGCQ